MYSIFYTGSLIDTVLFLFVYSCKELSFGSGKDLSWQPSTDSDSVNKQILISYVRAEAAQHALSLKEQLSELGFSVYLVSFDELHET